MDGGLGFVVTCEHLLIYCQVYGIIMVVHGSPRKHGSGWKDGVPVSKRPGSGNAAESRRKRPPEVETFLIKFPERFKCPAAKRRPTSRRRAAIEEVQQSFAGSACWSLGGVEQTSSKPASIDNRGGVRV
ncbi:hypothetical protein E3N88_23022 [Mikania micrantha]|uniref:Uncharacterized protein n=1 Tax=Mikania micrantha TaxID=192012 RepID=A0A5N6NC42_9ASTR|nr:hypothetical protein E3N88_23022 [Mikania micrantha]